MRTYELRRKGMETAPITGESAGDRAVGAGCGQHPAHHCNPRGNADLTPPLPPVGTGFDRPKARASGPPGPARF